MLSYIVPQSSAANEEKALPPRSLNLNHNLNITTSAGNTTTNTIDGITTTTTKATTALKTTSKNPLNTETASESMDNSKGGNRNQNKNGNNVEMLCDETTKLLSNERAQINTKNNYKITSDQNSDNNTVTRTTSTTIQFQQIGNDDDDDGNTNNTTDGGDISGQQGGRDDTTATHKNQTKKSKISKVGAKNTTLKRVSFGSSKGSMVETLIFETPTPLPEHAERVFGYPSLSSSPVPPSSSSIAITAAATNHNIENLISAIPSSQHQYSHRISSSINSSNTLKSTTTTGTLNNNNNSCCLDDSGIDLQEELERSKVRVTFYQSNQPQQVSPPESYLFYSDNSSIPLLPDSQIHLIDIGNGKTVLPSEMAASVETTAQISYDRQISTESGWDNPFRPGGDLSREADEIVNLIKGGKPITPTGDANQSIANGKAQTDLANGSIENGKAVVDGATKTEASHLQSTPAQNGTKSSQSKSSNDAKTATQTQVSNQVVPGPTSASHVVIQDKKKKKCNCCVIQ